MPMSDLTYFRIPDDHTLSNKKEVRTVIAACFSMGYYISPETAEYYLEKINGQLPNARADIIKSIKRVCLQDKIFMISLPQ